MDKAPTIAPLAAAARPAAQLNPPAALVGVPPVVRAMPQPQMQAAMLERQVAARRQAQLAVQQAAQQAAEQVAFPAPTLTVHAAFSNLRASSRSICLNREGEKVF